jgi:hypothetical protein
VKVKMVHSDNELFTKRTRAWLRKKVIDAEPSAPRSSVSEEHHSNIAIIGLFEIGPVDMNFHSWDRSVSLRWPSRYLFFNFSKAVMRALDNTWTSKFNT